MVGYDPDVEKNRAEAREFMQKLVYGPEKRLNIKVSTRNIAAYRDPDYQIGLNLTGSGVDDPDQQSAEADQQKRKALVWDIDKKLQEDVARPIIYHNRGGTFWRPQPPSRDPVSGTKRSAGFGVQAKADAVFLLGFARILIELDNLCRFAARADATAIHPDDPVTQGRDLLHVMRNHDQCAAAPEQFHEGEAFASESGVADGQGLIDDQDVGFGVNADREGQPRAHAGGIEPHRLIEKRTDRGKLGDRWYPPKYIRPAQSKDRATNQHILAARHLPIESGAKRQDRGDPSCHADFPAGGLCNTAQ